MLVKKLIALTISSIMVISIIFLINLVVQFKQFILPTSYPRMIVCIIIHIFVIGYTAIIYRLDQIRDILWYFFLMSVNISTFITITEIYIYRERNTFMETGDIKFKEPIEIVYLNVYFLTYIFSLLNGFVLGIVVTTLYCIDKARKRRIRMYLQQNVTHIEFTEQLKGEVCPICLSAFNQNEQLLQIKCKHIFHDSCLKQWIKVNTSCPNCRYNLFTDVDIDPDEMAQVRQGV